MNRNKGNESCNNYDDDFTIIFAFMIQINWCKLLTKWIEIGVCVKNAP